MARSPQHREKLQQQLQRLHDELARETLPATLQAVVDKIGQPSAPVQVMIESEGMPSAMPRG